MELAECGCEVWEHVITDSQGRETSYSCCAVGGWEDEEENLCDVVVALEVVEVWVLTEYGGYEVRELSFVLCGLLGCLVGWVVDECAVDVELDLVFVFVWWEVAPALVADRLLIEAGMADGNTQ